MIKVFSYGGGVQSTAALVLAAQGRIDYQTFLFCNVGDDSEHPDTLAYVEQVAKPYAQAQGLELIELKRYWRQGERAGQVSTLYGLLTDPKRVSPGGIPVRLQSGAPAMRACTNDFKIDIVDRWLKEHGAKEQGAMVGLGISSDEFLRARNDSGIEWKKLDYPLLDMRLTRQDCLNIIESAGLPEPPKSSCWFCPYHSITAWRKLRDTRPDLFQKSCDLEALLRKRSHERGRGELYMTDRRKPLAEAIAGQQDSMFDDACESGYCMV